MSKTLPIIPMRTGVLFPGVSLPITAGRAATLRAIEVALRAGMAKNGIVGAAQDEIIQGIKSFALYGFPESHAASFALLAYASAYLKAYHHAAFTAALLKSWHASIPFTAGVWIGDAWLIPLTFLLAGFPAMRLRGTPGRFVVAAFVVVAFVCAGFGMGFVTHQFFPISDRPEVIAEIQMPEGTSIATTSATTAEVNAQSE